MSRESVRLAFTIAYLNGVDVMSCELENVYMNAIWFEGRTECGEDIYLGANIMKVKMPDGCEVWGSS